MDNVKVDTQKKQLVKELEKKQKEVSRKQKDIEIIVEYFMILKFIIKHNITSFQKSSNGRRVFYEELHSLKSMPIFLGKLKKLNPISHKTKLRRSSTSNTFKSWLKSMFLFNSKQESCPVHILS